MGSSRMAEKSAYHLPNQEQRGWRVILFSNEPGSEIFTATQTVGANSALASSRPLSARRLYWRTHEVGAVSTAAGRIFTIKSSDGSPGSDSELQRLQMDTGKLRRTHPSVTATFVSSMVTIQETLRGLRLPQLHSPTGASLGGFLGD